MDTVKSLMLVMALAKEQFYNIGNPQAGFRHPGPPSSPQGILLPHEDVVSVLIHQARAILNPK